MSAAISEDRPQRNWTPPEPEELEGFLDGFEIRELIGQGGMGAVYRAYQASLRRDVAIKILPPELSEDAAFAERFQREAWTMAKLNHPNIVHVYDLGRQEPTGWLYLVMELVDGADLRALTQYGKLAPEQALDVVAQICSALQHAHELGYVHRDIKPANVFLMTDGRVKVGDFGLAKLLSPAGAEDSEVDLTMTGQAVGTVDYIAPEVLRGEGDVDHRADLYSLGVMFYELLTGDRPRGRFAPPSRKVSIDVRVDEVVLRSLEEERERRYQSADDIRTDVDRIRGRKKRDRSNTGRSRKWFWLAAAAAVLILAAIPALHWIMGEHPDDHGRGTEPNPDFVLTEPYRIMDFETFESDGRLMYAGLMEPGAFQTRMIYDYDLASFQTQLAGLRAEGMSVFDLETFEQSNLTRIYVGFASPGESLTIFEGNWQHFRRSWQEAEINGYRMLDFEVLPNPGGGISYAGVLSLGGWNPRALIESDWNTFLRLWSELEDEGYRMSDFEAYVNQAGELTFVGVFDPGNYEPFALFETDWRSFVRELRKAEKKGQRMIDLEVYKLNGEQQFVGIFEPGGFQPLTFLRDSWEVFREELSRFEAGPERR